MRWLLAAAVSIGMAHPVGAQSTLDRPIGEFRPYSLDTGVRDNAGNTPETAFADTVWVKGAEWVRLYFKEVDLEEGSFVRITSLFDGEVQVLDAAALQRWNNSSAYFNGSALLVELVTGPKTQRNRAVIDQVAIEEMSQLPVGSCGICGADDRLPSDEDWSSRMLPAGCTASVWNADSCLVSAGHCVTGNDVVQFRVPNSNPNCTLNHPPVADQFPITQVQFQNGGVGQDWSAMTAGPNGLGQLPYERYGVFVPIASSPPAVGNSVAVWGYGIDSQCTLSQTQQTHDGSVVSVSGTFFNFNVDITYGNSGSAVVRNGEILGIVTHCPCPSWATRVDHASFVAARDNLCGGGAEPVEAELRSFSVSKGILLSGDLTALEDSDDVSVEIEAVLNNSGSRSLTNTLISLKGPFIPVSQIDLTTEVGVDVAANNLRTKVYLRNWTTGSWDLIDNYLQSPADTERVTLDIPNPNDYVRVNGRRIKVRIQTKVKTQNVPEGYAANIDHVQVTVTE